MSGWRRRAWFAAARRWLDLAGALGWLADRAQDASDWCKRRGRRLTRP